MRLVDADKIDPAEAFIGGSDFAQHLRERVRQLIAEQPTIEAAPVVHAHWTLIGSVLAYGMVYECSACKRRVMRSWESIGGKIDIYEEYPYCNCGAKMDKEAQENGTE